MKDSFFKNYSKNHVHFYDEAFPAFLELGFDLISEVEKPSIADLGCGDGRLLFALNKRGLLDRFSEIVGVDISPKRIERLTKELPFIKGIISDASNVKDYLSSSFDYIVCSQVIEHVQDDTTLVAEIKRLLKCGGVAFISSVIKHRCSFYVYYTNGSFSLDPTHVREYSSIDEFVSLIKSKGFEIINIDTCQITFPFLDLIYRLFGKFGFIEPDSSFFQKYKSLADLRKLRIPIIGYKNIAILVRNNE